MTSVVRREELTLSDEEIAAFIARPGLVTVVGTVNPDGTPHLATMGYVVRGRQLALLSYKKTQKCANLRRDPRITCLIETGEGYHDICGVQIRGTVTFSDDLTLQEEVMAGFAERYPSRTAGDVGRQARASIEPVDGRLKRTVILVEPERYISWDHRKLRGAY